MSRTKQIQTRPELPSLEEITHDLESAPSDDVAFTFLRNYASGTKETPQGSLADSLNIGLALAKGTTGLGDATQARSRDVTRTYESAAKRPRQEASKSAGPSKHQAGEHQLGPSRLTTENSEVHECYLKVQKFLEMNSYLRDSQEKLSQQCSHLQELGQSVKDQIASLKTQLHS